MDEFEKSGDEDGDKKLPPVNGTEYPEKPEGDVSATEIMKWMEQVDRYWQVCGFQKLNQNQERPDEEEGDDTA